MAIKMRVLCYPENNKKLRAIGEMIKAEYDLNVNSVDRIPPAYSCDKERLVILATQIKGSLPDSYRLFVRELTKARAANVAIIAAGDEACVEKTKELLREAGTNVIDSVHNVKIGLFNTKVTDEEKADVLAWVKSCVESLN
ncbi:MAG: hypothetical protein E7649_04295 [Ruminococcaceae bacterium]|nr:hypothetical protein [Oscillospiraceae bacterium]